MLRQIPVTAWQEHKSADNGTDTSNENAPLPAVHALERIDDLLVAVSLAFHRRSFLSFPGPNQSNSSSPLLSSFREAGQTMPSLEISGQTPAELSRCGPFCLLNQPGQLVQLLVNRIRFGSNFDSANSQTIVSVSLFSAGYIHRAVISFD